MPSLHKSSSFLTHSPCRTPVATTSPEVFALTATLFSLIAIEFTLMVGEIISAILSLITTEDNVF